MVTDQGALSEDQVVQHQLLGNTQVISHTLIALVLSRVATHAVVDEGTRAILQGSLVGQIDVGFIQVVAAATGGRGQCRYQRKHQGNQLFFH